MKQLEIDLEGDIKCNGKKVNVIPIGRPRTLLYQNKKIFLSLINKHAPINAYGYTLSYERPILWEIEGYVIHEKVRGNLRAIQYYKECRDKTNS